MVLKRGPGASHQVVCYVESELNSSSVITYGMIFHILFGF